MYSAPGGIGYVPPRTNVYAPTHFSDQSSQPPPHYGHGPQTSAQSVFRCYDSLVPRLFGGGEKKSLVHTVHVCA